MAETKVLTELVEQMKSEVKWFRNAAQKHALNASKTVVIATRVAELVEQEAHMRVGDKLAERAERFESASTR